MLYQILLHYKLRIANRHKVKDINIYYIDMSVLPKNRQLVFSIRNYIRDTSEDVADVIPLFFLCFLSSFFFIFETLISM